MPDGLLLNQVALSQHENMWERAMKSYKWVHHLPQVRETRTTVAHVMWVNPFPPKCTAWVLILLSRFKVVVLYGRVQYLIKCGTRSV